MTATKENARPVAATTGTGGKSTFLSSHELSHRDFITPETRRQDVFGRFDTNGDIFRQTKERVSMMEAATFYGYTPNRAGFIRCPFHGGGNEKTPSCKLYENGWHCFGCQTGGTVIDFTARLFDLSPLEAVKRLNTDFSLGLSLDRHAPTPEELAAARKRQEVRDTLEAFQRWRKSALDILARAIGVGNNARIHGTMDKWTEAECLAVREQARLEYFYDELEAGDNQTQFACLCDWEEVNRIATRICGK